MRPHFPFVGVRNIFDTFYDFGLECVTFFEQFVDALRIRALAVRQTLEIAGLAAGARTQSLGFENDGILALTLATHFAFLQRFLLFRRGFPGRRSLLRHFFAGCRFPAGRFLAFGRLLLFAGFGWHGRSLPLTRDIAAISCCSVSGRDRRLQSRRASSSLHGLRDERLKYLPEITPERLAFGFIWYVAFLFSTTCHEAAHALVAKLGGDETAALGGQVSLNPVPHITRALGMMVIPIVSYLATQSMFGWASAPYDPLWERRHPRRSGWMALAGPAANSR